MVVKMIKWRAALSSRKFEARLVVKRLEGLEDEMMMGRLRTEIKWKGSKVIGGLGLLRGVKRNQTNDGVFDDDGVCQWDEEFRNSCSFIRLKDCGICSWEVVVTVVNGSIQDPENKGIVTGTVTLNLGEYVSSGQVNELPIRVPLTLADGNTGSCPLLVMSLSLKEMKCSQDIANSVGTTSALSSKSALSPEKERVSTPSGGRKKVNLFKGCVTSPRRELANPEDEINNRKFCNSSESNDKISDSDTDSVKDLHEEGFTDAGKDETNMQPLSYRPLTYVNIGHSISANSAYADDWIYYSDRNPHLMNSYVENSSTPVQDSSVRQKTKHRFLSWRKRKLRFKSTRSKGEPLLKKDCRDEGGDDIDFDRRRLTSSDESSFGWRKTDGSSTSRSSFSEFEDNGFCVGAWEKKGITCRDGHKKLETQVFFASMDQRSERAAGESACTALVAVIAEWLQSNKCEMPIKSEFDRLIRDGSSEWRNMCQNQAYMERFPDKHFDLETVLEANIRPLSVVPEKSFVGFFHPEGIEENSCLDILHGSMSFDEIWDEIDSQASEVNTSCSPSIYIVSWNDHFFILKVEQGAYYLIDTLGERLHEGCNEAYILKFDHDTKIKQIPNEAEASGETSPERSVQESMTKKPDKNSKDSLASNVHSVSEEVERFCNECLIDSSSSKTNAEGGPVLVSSGKESCKEYIKSFLTAIPIRQMQEDIKKGLTSVQLHQRLQIEFHFTATV